MGDDDDRAAPRQQVLGQPADALDVEVVGRLVEHDQVEVADQRGGQRDAALLAAGQPVDGAGRGRAMPSPSSTSRTCGRPPTRARPPYPATARRRGPGRPAGASSPCARCAMCSPPTRLTRPPSGARRPVRMSSSVVLPPPLSPTTPIRSPRSTPSDTRVEQHPRRVAGDVRGDRLQVDEVRPGRIRRAPAASGRPGSGELVRSTTGARHRPVRHPDGAAHAHARPARWRRRSRRRRRRTGTRRSGPDPETSPASAPASTPGPQGAAQVGGHADGRRLQVVAQRQGELARVAARDGLQHRLDGPLGERAAAAAQPVQLAEHGGRGEPAAVQRDHPVLGCRDSTGTICSPRPGAQRGAAVQRERDVAAQLGGRARPARRGSGRASTAPTGPTSAAAASALPPAMPPATGMPLRSTQPHVRIPVGALGQQLDGPPGEVGLVGRHLGDALAVHLRCRARRSTATVTSSNRLTAWNTVTRSWKPSSRRPPTARCRLILAGTRTVTGGGTADNTRPTYVRGCRVQLTRWPLRRARASACGRRWRGRAKHEHRDQPDQQHRGRQQQRLRHRRGEASCAGPVGSCATPPRRTWPPAGSSAASRACHQHGDARAAQHRPDLAGGVVDTGAGAGLAHRQVAGGRGGDRAPT